METALRPLALVTGASSGIGAAMARELADQGFDLVLTAADDLGGQEGLDGVADPLRARVDVQAVQADLRTEDGAAAVYASVTEGGRRLDAALLNAGIGRGGGSFVQTPLEDHLDVVRLNVLGTVRLAGLLLPDMVAADHGRMLITSSLVAGMPGSYQLTYNASKAFLQSFARGLQHELSDSAVTVTVLMPGPVETPFFRRAGMAGTLLERAPKEDPATVARQGVDAMNRGRRTVVGGSLASQLFAAGLAVTPGRVRGWMQSAMSKPPRRDAA